MKRVQKGRVDIPVAVKVQLPNVNYAGDEPSVQHTFNFELRVSGGRRIWLDEEDIPPELEKRINSLAFALLLSRLKVSGTKERRSLKRRASFFIGSETTVKVKLRKS